MSKRSYRDKAIVLRTHDLGEADRIITLLTRDNGKVRAVAKGVRKTKSRYGSRLEPFSYVDIQLYAGKTFEVVSQVESINAYHRVIITNYDVYTAASAILETCDRIISDEGLADLAHFVLLHGAIHAIATNAHHPELILGSYILRAMSYSGWELAIYECAICGEAGPHEALNISVGGAVCNNCAPPGSARPTIDTWQLLAALNAGDWNIADLAQSPARKSTLSIITSFLQWHLEKNVASLKYVGNKHLGTEAGALPVNQARSEGVSDGAGN
ncbi:MAG: DNA repair protein RecO [Arcanobacterium sp.]|nr:DNA repair protein RecO [Arcanobacterium sp.]